MTLKYAEDNCNEGYQMNAQMYLALLNIVIAGGTILSALVSWWRGGMVAVFIKNIGRIEEIQGDVKEINHWKNKTDTLLVALALGNENVDDRKAMEKVGLKTEYKDILNENWNSEEEKPADD